ncbi:hypothetical protein ACVRZC_03450 [Streptococcus hyointestinalis]|uniref:Uncharacterized protein n=1 Tax=Streptococcus hyointestinalis TaxID=1337 RepID=A0A380K1T5_9STRE|nr:hypothetical protein [Streptococcus hyointestinalis]SUN58146.1 Uncharacterised protein [Streptococcus hyointestinalis]
MASRKASLTGYDAEIEKLQKQITKAKAERKRYEDGLKQDIGNQYVQLLLLDNPDVDIEQVAKDIKQQVKDKKELLKIEKEEANSAATSPDHQKQN